MFKKSVKSGAKSPENENSANAVAEKAQGTDRNGANTAQNNHSDCVLKTGYAKKLKVRIIIQMDSLV